MSTKDTSQVTNYDISSVKKENRQSWVKILSIWIGMLYSVSVMTYGGLVGEQLPLGQALLAIVCGNAVLAILSIAISNIGADTGLGSYALMRYFLGTVGGKIVSMMLVVVILGWNGIGALIILDMLAFYMPFFETQLGFVIASVVLQFLFVSTVWFSFKGLSVLSRIAVPVILIIFVIGLVQTERIYGIATLFDKMPTNPQSFIAVATGIVMVWINGPIQSTDLSRFSRSKKDTFLAVSIAFVLGATFIYTVGSITTIATGYTDVSEIFNALQIVGLSSVMILLLIWTTCAESYYSAALGFATVFPSLKKGIILFICFIGATIFSLFDIFAYFLQWVNLVGLFFGPVIALFIVDYYFFKEKYQVKSEDIKIKISYAAVVAIVVGIATNLAIAEYGALLSILTSGVAYFIFNKYVFKDRVLEQARQLLEEKNV